LTALDDPATRFKLRNGDNWQRSSLVMGAAKVRRREHRAAGVAIVAFYVISVRIERKNWNHSCACVKLRDLLRFEPSVQRSHSCTMPAVSILVSRFAQTRHHGVLDRKLHIFYARLTWQASAKAPEYRPRLLWHIEHGMLILVRLSLNSLGHFSRVSYGASFAWVCTVRKVILLQCIEPLFIQILQCTEPALILNSSVSWSAFEMFSV
jgi:hypothetical protein